MESLIKSKNFPDCANEALSIIRSTYNRIGKKELGHLANEYIFINEFNKEQNTWVKVKEMFYRFEKYTKESVLKKYEKFYGHKI